MCFVHAHQHHVMDYKGAREHVCCWPKVSNAFNDVSNFSSPPARLMLCACATMSDFLKPDVTKCKWNVGIIYLFILICRMICIRKWASTPTLSILTLQEWHFQKCHFQIFSEIANGTILTILEKILTLTLSRMTLLKEYEYMPTA